MVLTFPVSRDLRSNWGCIFTSDILAFLLTMLHDAKLQLLQGPFNTVTFMQSEPKCTWYSALVPCGPSGLELLYSALRNTSRRPLQWCFSPVTHSWLQLTCIHGRSEAQVLLQWCCSLLILQHHLTRNWVHYSKLNKWPDNYCFLLKGKSQAFFACLLEVFWAPTEQPTEFWALNGFPSPEFHYHPRKHRGQDLHSST